MSKMLGLLLTVTVAGTIQGWQSKFFQDVRLHTGQPPVTIQVAWLKPKPVSTASVMPAVVSVFSGRHGERRLVSSTRVGNVGYYPPAEFFVDEASGEGFLSLWIKVAGKSQAGIFRFDRNRLLLVLRRPHLWPEHHAGRFVVTESAWAKDVGLKIPKEDHPNPPAERIFRYDSKSKAFRPGPWRVCIFNPPATSEIRGKNGTHSFVVRLSKRNFRLGNRKVAFNRQGYLTVGGLVAYGASLNQSEGVGSYERQRELFMTELTSFRAWIDGREVLVPERLWKTCFDPNLGLEHHLFARISKDGKRLVVEMSGSDAGGGYRAIWTLRPNGRHTRKIDDSC